MLRYTADKPGAYSGTLKLSDAHAAPTTAAGNLLTAGGKLVNGLQYETEVQLVNSGGHVTATPDGVLHIENADTLTIFVAAGTNYLANRARGWRGDAPHERIERQLRAAAVTSYAGLRAAHVADYQALFRRVTLNLGSNSGSAAADLPTDERLVRYRDGAEDGELEALFFQYGRYLLISSSRPGSLPANLQGLWNNSNNPPWRSDYHSNINIQMNYWLAEPTNLRFSITSTACAKCAPKRRGSTIPMCAAGQCRPRTTFSERGASSGILPVPPGTRSITGSTTRSPATWSSCEKQLTRCSRK